MTTTRFAAVEEKAAASGAENPAAVAAAAGRKAHGEKEMEKFSKEGEARAKKPSPKGGRYGGYGRGGRCG